MSPCWRQSFGRCRRHLMLAAGTCPTLGWVRLIWRTPLWVYWLIMIGPAGGWAMIAFICTHSQLLSSVTSDGNKSAANTQPLCGWKSTEMCVCIIVCDAHTSHVEMTVNWKHTTCIVWRLYTLTTWKLKLYIPLRGAMKLLLSSSKFLPTFTRTWKKSRRDRKEKREERR